jgi:V/A-type H+-transporting ATPase subunit I
MSRLLIVATKDHMGPVVSELYRRHLFHIEEFVDQARPEYEGFRIGTPLSGATESSSDLVNVRAIENAIAVRSDDFEPKVHNTHAALMEKIGRDLPAVTREVEGLTGQRAKLDAAVKECEQKIAEITPFVGIPIDLDLYYGYSGTE